MRLESAEPLTPGTQQRLATGRESILSASARRGDQSVPGIDEHGDKTLAMDYMGLDEMAAITVFCQFHPRSADVLPSALAAEQVILPT